MFWRKTWLNIVSGILQVLIFLCRRKFPIISHYVWLYRLPRKLALRKEKWENLLRYNLIIIHSALLQAMSSLSFFRFLQKFWKDLFIAVEEVLHRLNTRPLYSLSRARNHRHYRFESKRKPFSLCCFHIYWLIVAYQWWIWILNWSKQREGVQPL